MVASEAETIVLDYAGVEEPDDILKNLSGIAAAGRFLWTASDEGRTVECLEPDGDGYRLRKQHHLDCLFDGLPNEKDDDDDTPAEADIESLAFFGGALWICGSHCDVRFQTKKDRKKEKGGLPYPLRYDFNTRAGRHLLGKVTLTDEGGTPAKRGSHLPFRKSKGSLHSILKGNPFLKPFIGLPSKENGLDIEGFTTSDGQSLFLGLRGPRVDRYAVVVELEVRGSLKSAKPKMATHFLDLDGLAVRDLAHFDDKEILVLAGPVGEAPGPFGLYRWLPSNSACAQKPAKFDWQIDPQQEKPEGICRLDRNGMSGAIVLYDSPDPCKRIDGSTYKADWFPLT